MKQIVVVLFLAATAGRAEMLRLEASVDAMGSTFSVILYDESRSRMEAAAEEAFAEVRRLDLMLSNYRAGSELSEVNRNAATRPVKVTPELFALLQTCLGFSRASGGAFDITVGPLMKVWGFYKGSGRLPHRAEIRGVLTRIGYKNILLDEENRTVSFARQGVELDPGGIGKGYAVDKLAEKLRETDIKTALVTASGSSIFGMGSPTRVPAFVSPEARECWRKAALIRMECSGPPSRRRRTPPSQRTQGRSLRACRRHWPPAR